MLVGNGWTVHNEAIEGTFDHLCFVRPGGAVPSIVDGKMHPPTTDRVNEKEWGTCFHFYNIEADKACIDEAPVTHVVAEFLDECKIDFAKGECEK